MILAGKLQFYQLQKRKNKKNSGSDGIWTQASQNITTNWATEVNVNSICYIFFGLVYTMILNIIKTPSQFSLYNQIKKKQQQQNKSKKKQKKRWNERREIMCCLECS